MPQAEGEGAAVVRHSRFRAQPGPPPQSLRDSSPSGGAVDPSAPHEQCNGLPTSPSDARSRTSAPPPYSDSRSTCVRHSRGSPPPPPFRHSCAGRNPCEHPSPIRAPNARRPSNPPEPGRRGPAQTPDATSPSDARSRTSAPPPYSNSRSTCVRRSRGSPPPPPFRHSCAGRNPCEHPSPIRAPNARRRSNPPEPGRRGPAQTPDATSPSDARSRTSAPPPYSDSRSTCARHSRGSPPPPPASAAPE